MKKQIKDGSLYYRQKDILRPIGAVLMPVGLVWFYLGWSYLSYILPSIMLPAGLILFIVGGSKTISDNDMTELMDHALLDYDKPVTEMPGYERIVLKQPVPVEISAYSFGKDATYFKKGKNGTPISDRMTRTHVFYMKDGVILIGRTLSIASLNEATGEGITDFTHTFSFGEITSASLDVYETPVTLSNTGKVTTVKWCELSITGEDGELLRIPVKNDMDASNLCDFLNRRTHLK